MARLPNQNMLPGLPDKPATLSDKAGKEWDLIMSELQASGIQISKAHRSLIVQAATIGADLADCRETVECEGAYVENEKTGALQLHPAARRLDGLRRDYIKVMSLLGLRSAVRAPEPEQSLEDLLKGQ